MEHLAEQFKALADPTRLRVLRLLLHGELCICDLMASLALPQSTISRHMAVLKRAGWATGRRGGKWVYYSLAAPQGLVAESLLPVLGAVLPELPETRDDESRYQAHMQTKSSATCGDGHGVSS